MHRQTLNLKDPETFIKHIYPAKWNMFIPILLISFYIFSQLGFTAEAASRKNRSQPQSSTEVKTGFFSLALPDGWKMLKPVKTHPNGDVSAVFVPTGGSLAVTINIIHVPASAEVIATTTAQNIEKTGFQASEVTERDGIWHFSISGKENGQAWFGANGKICAIVLMFGKNYQQANVLLSNLKSPDRKIFPANVN